VASCSSASSSSQTQNRRSLGELYPLHEAAARGDIGRVREYLQQSQYSVWKRDEIGNTPLHYADDARITRLLLEAGASPRDQNEHGVSALAMATQNGWEGARAAMEGWRGNRSSFSTDNLLDLAEIGHILSHVDFLPIGELSKPIKVYGQTLTHHYNYGIIGTERGVKEFARHMAHFEREAPIFAAHIKEQMKCGEVVAAVVESSGEMIELANYGRFHSEKLQVAGDKSGKSWFVVDTRTLKEQGGAGFAGLVSHEEFHSVQEALRRSRKGIALGEGLPYTIAECRELRECWMGMVAKHGWRDRPPVPGTAAHTIFTVPYDQLLQMTVHQDQCRRLGKFVASAEFKTFPIESQSSIKQLLRDSLESLESNISKLNTRFFDEIGTSLMEAKVEFGLEEVLKIEGAEQLAATFDSIYGKKFFLEPSAVRTRALIKYDALRLGRFAVKHGFSILMGIELVLNSSHAMRECRAIEGEDSAWAAHGLIRGATRLVSDFIVSHLDVGVAGATSNSYLGGEASSSTSPATAKADQERIWGPIVMREFERPIEVPSVDAQQRARELELRSLAGLPKPEGPRAPFDEKIAEKIEAAKMVHSMRFGRTYAPTKYEPTKAEVDAYNQYCAERWRAGEQKAATAWCNLYDSPPQWLWSLPPAWGFLLGPRLFDAVMHGLAEQYPNDPDCVAHVASEMTSLVQGGTLFPPEFAQWSPEKRAEWASENLIDRAEQVMDQSIKEWKQEDKAAKEREEVDRRNSETNLTALMALAFTGGIDPHLATDDHQWWRYTTADINSGGGGRPERQDGPDGDDSEPMPVSDGDETVERAAEEVRSDNSSDHQQPRTSTPLPPPVDPNLYRRKPQFHFTPIPGGIRIGPTDQSFIVDVAAGTGRGVTVLISGKLLEWGPEGVATSELWAWIAKAGHAIGKAMPVVGPVVFAALVGLELNDYYARKRASKRADDIEENRDKSEDDVSSRYKSTWSPLMKAPVGQLDSEGLGALRGASAFIEKKMEDIVNSVKTVAKDPKLKQIDKQWTVAVLGESYSRMAQKKAMIDLRIAHEDFFNKFKDAPLDALKASLPSALPEQQRILTRLAMDKILPAAGEPLVPADVVGPVGEIAALVPGLSDIQRLHSTLVCADQMDMAGQRAVDGMWRLDLAQVGQSLALYLAARTPGNEPLLGDVEKPVYSSASRPMSDDEIAQAKKNGLIDKDTRHDLTRPGSTNDIVDTFNRMSFEELTADTLNAWISFFYGKNKKVCDRENRGTLDLITGEKVGDGYIKILAVLEPMHKDRLYWDQLQGKDFDSLMALVPKAKGEKQRAFAQIALKGAVEKEVRSGSPDAISHLGQYEKEFDDSLAGPLAELIKGNEVAASILSDLPAHPNCEQLGGALSRLARELPDTPFEKISTSLGGLMNHQLDRRDAELHNRWVDYIEGKGDVSFASLCEELNGLYQLHPELGMARSGVWLDYSLAKGRLGEATQLIDQLKEFGSDPASHLAASRAPVLFYRKGECDFSTYHKQMVEGAKQLNEKQRGDLFNLYYQDFVIFADKMKSAREITEFLEKVCRDISESRPDKLEQAIGVLMDRAGYALLTDLSNALKKGRSTDGVRTTLDRLYRIDSGKFKSVYRASIAFLIQCGKPDLADAFCSQWKEGGELSSEDRLFFDEVQPFIDCLRGKVKEAALLRHFDRQIKEASDERKKQLRQMAKGALLPLVQRRFQSTQQAFSSLGSTVGRDWADQPTRIPGLRGYRAEHFDQGRARQARQLVGYLLAVHEFDPALLAMLVQYSAGRHSVQREVLREVAGPQSTLSALREIFWDGADWNGSKHTVALLRVIEHMARAGGTDPVGDVASTLSSAVAFPGRLDRILETVEGKFDLISMGLPTLFDLIDQSYRERTGYVPQMGAYHLFKGVASPLVGAVSAALTQRWERVAMSGGVALYRGLQSQDQANRARMMNVQIDIEAEQFAGARRRIDDLRGRSLRLEDSELVDELEVALAYAEAAHDRNIQQFQQVINLSDHWLNELPTAATPLSRPSNSVLYRRGSALLALHAKPGFKEKWTRLLAHFEHRKILPAGLLAHYHSIKGSKLAQSCLARISAAESRYIPPTGESSFIFVDKPEPSKSVSTRKRGEKDALSPHQEEAAVRMMKRSSAALFDHTVRYLQGEISEKEMVAVLRTRYLPRSGGQNQASPFVQGWATFMQVLAESARGNVRAESFEQLEQSQQLGFQPPIDFFLSCIERRGVGLPLSSKQLVYHLLSERRVIVPLLCDRFDYEEWELHEKILLLMSLSKRAHQSKWRGGGGILLRGLLSLARDVIRSSATDKALVEAVRDLHGDRAASYENIEKLLKAGADPDQLAGWWWEGRNRNDAKAEFLEVGQFCDVSDSLLHCISLSKRDDLIRLFSRYEADFGRLGGLDTNALEKFLATRSTGQLSAGEAATAKALIEAGIDPSKTEMWLGTNFNYVSDLKPAFRPIGYFDAAFTSLVRWRRGYIVKEEPDRNRCWTEYFRVEAEKIAACKGATLPDAIRKVGPTVIRFEDTVPAAASTSSSVSVRQLKSPTQIASMSVTDARRYKDQVKHQSWRAKEIAAACVAKENWKMLGWYIDECIETPEGFRKDRIFWESCGSAPLGSLDDFSKDATGKRVPTQLLCQMLAKGVIKRYGYHKIIREGRTDLARRYLSSSVELSRVDFNPLLNPGLLETIRDDFIAAALAGHYEMVVWLKERNPSRLSLALLDPEGVYAGGRNWLREVKEGGEIDVYRWFLERFQHTPGDTSYVEGQGGSCLVM